MTAIVTNAQDFPRAFEAALNAADLDGMAALYEEEAVLRIATGETRSGQAATRDEMRQLIDAGAAITNTLRLALQTECLALIVVDYTLRLTAPDGRPVTLDGTATNVIRRHPERGWRMAIANPQGTSDGTHGVAA